MAGFIALAVAILLGGSLAGLTHRMRWALIAGLWALALACVTLAPSSAAARALGGAPLGWLWLGGGGLVFGLYRIGLRRLRARSGPGDMARPAPSEPKAPETDPTRYLRHITLREIGGPGQARLRAAHVVVVGAGGLGAPVLSYLAAAGVGRITVIDGDQVEVSNLQRQVIFRMEDVGAPKAEAAARAMVALNPEVTVIPRVAMLTEETAASLLAGADLVIDGCDSIATRLVTNRAAHAAGLPLVVGAIGAWDGQVSSFLPDTGPCYQCLVPKAPAPGALPDCALAGVAGPLPGIIGTLMALEAVKILTGAGDPLVGRLLLFDGLTATPRVMRIGARADCPACGVAPAS